MAQRCTHRDQIDPNVVPSSYGCRDCQKTGDEWVHLRICMTCGYVGCCDSSKNKHARRHFQDAGHPVVQSFEAGEEWMWCYVDNVYLKE